MNIKNIIIEEKYKWRELCKLLEIPYSSGNTRKKELKTLTSLCKWRKEGCYYIIEEIYKVKLLREDKRKGRDGGRKQNGKYNHLNEDLTKKERFGEFDGYYVYAHYIGEEVVYIGKGCRDRINQTIGRKYDLLLLTKGKILKRFDNEQQALDYEKKAIEEYKAIGQCKYNDDFYHKGKRRNFDKEKEFNEKVNEDFKKMFKFMI